MRLAVILLVAASLAMAHEGRRTRTIYEMPEPTPFLEFAAMGVLVFTGIQFLESKEQRQRAKAKDKTE